MTDMENIKRVLYPFIALGNYSTPDDFLDKLDEAAKAILSMSPRREYVSPKTIEKLQELIDPQLAGYDACCNYSVERCIKIITGKEE